MEYSVSSNPLSLSGVFEQDPLTWPTVGLICSRVKDDNGETLYQGAVIAHYTPTTLKMCADSAIADAKQLEVKMKTRLEWSDLEMLRAILVFLDTSSWSCVAALPTVNVLLKPPMIWKRYEKRLNISLHGLGSHWKLKVLT